MKESMDYLIIIKEYSNQHTLNLLNPNQYSFIRSIRMNFYYRFIFNSFNILPIRTLFIIECSE